jgi:uncharacterized membrane protein YfcA
VILQTLVVFLAGVVAGALNSVAGGGTLVSFPTLLWLGRDPIVANATSTVSIWPASLAGAFGFREDLRAAKRWVMLLILPSIAGGALGGWLLLRTPSTVFERVVPILLLAATIMLAAQETFSRHVGDIASEHQSPSRGWITFVVIFQFLVSIYGGYFGAGMGILMLAALGLIGLTDLHQMNGVKNVLGLSINGVAALYFVVAKAVEWNDVAALMTGTLTGGYFGARLARRLGRTFVRRLVVVLGIVMTIATAISMQ